MTQLAMATDRRVCWDDSDVALLECRAVLDITPDVRTFHLAGPLGTVFEFEAGQFITLELEIGGERINRCYTISSPPTRPHLLSITVKRVPGGPVSNWLHDNVVPGTQLSVREPLGVFTLPQPPAPKYLFLSAGSGVTPVMSMTRTLTDLGQDVDIVFVHSARTPVDIVFRGELEALSAVHPNLRVLSVCEDDHITQRWPGLRGRLSAQLLGAVVPDLAERAVYTCGPAPYMAAVRNILQELEFDMAGYHEESFSFEAVAPDLGAAADEVGSPGDDDAATSGTTAQPTYAIEFARSGVRVPCPAGTSILDAAAAAGVRIPSSCAQGLCGTCKTVALCGEVDMQHQGGIRPREIAQGAILPCCSTPLSDVVLDA